MSSVPDHAIRFVSIYSPEYFKKLLVPDFSAGNTRRQEESTYMNFLDFVEECEGIVNYSDCPKFPVLLVLN